MFMPQKPFGAVLIALKYTHILNALERVISLYQGAPLAFNRGWRRLRLDHAKLKVQ
jgi:hypothetical protein